LTVRISRFDVAHDPRLRDLMALDGDGDVHVDDLAAGRVGEVLRRGPDALATARALQRRDGRAEATAAEQEAAPRDEPWSDLQRPPVGVVARAQTEDGAGVHRAATVRRPV